MAPVHGTSRRSGKRAAHGTATVAACGARGAPFTLAVSALFALLATPGLSRGDEASPTAAQALAALAGRTGAAAKAQDALDPRWLPWLGCWEPVPDEGDDGTTDARPHLVCVEPLDDETGVEVVTVRGLDIVSRKTLRADGEMHPVAEPGCSGWETTRWSGDGHRLYFRSELECASGLRQTASGLSTLMPRTVWLDVLAVRAGGEPAVLVRRYRPAEDERLQEAGIAPVAPERSRAIAIARLAAAQRWSVPDVKEAVAEVAPEVVRAALAERGEGFRLDAEVLVQLADAGVPGEVTDLMIALSYPQRFRVERGEPLRISPLEPQGERRAREPVAYRSFDPFWYDPWYGYSYYGWLYSPYGFGYPYGWWYPTGGPVIVVGRAGEEAEAGGRVIKGLGYSRNRGRTAGQGEGTRPSPSWTGSGSGRSPSVAPARGSATSGGFSGGRSSTSTGRTAKPRPPQSP